MKRPRLNTVRKEDCLAGMRKMPDAFVDLVFTSPPYADLRDYARIRPDDYVGWFLPIAYEIRRLLKPRGSFVLNLNDRCVRGARHTFVHRLVVAMVDVVRMPLIETYIWQKPNAMPGKFGPRLKDAFEYVFWFGRSADVRFFPKQVGVPYAHAPRSKPSGRTKVRYRKGGQRMNGATIYERGFADPGNVVACPVVRGDSEHPARMPDGLAEFFIKLATHKGDIVLDPFMGSGTTARVSRALGRKYLGFEIHPEYLDV
ncbi:MAG TPA: site-specific DNA-methyltransferase [Planctomycetota bacterium]|nr:site-specific DNA-methyltransferase [Planctomycetota bacterium]